jgi:amidase
MLFHHTPSQWARPTHEVIYASATALTRAIRAKEISSAEVVQTCLQRIAAVNPALNAVVQLHAEAALAEARAADAALARGQRTGPLHGVPITIKDSLDTAGIITTEGTTGRATYVPAQDATIVARLSGWVPRTGHIVP